MSEKHGEYQPGNDETLKIAKNRIKSELFDKPEEMQTEAPSGDAFFAAVEKNRPKALDEGQKNLEAKYAAHETEVKYQEEMKEKQKIRNANKEVAAKKTLKQRWALGIAALTLAASGGRVAETVLETPNIEKPGRDEGGSISHIQEAYINDGARGKNEELAQSMEVILEAQKRAEEKAITGEPLTELEKNAFPDTEKLE